MTDNQNAALHFVDRHVAQGRGDKTAFREAAGARRAVSYGELARRTDLVAGAFAKADIRPEERAACILLDQVEYPEIFWGALKAGVVPIAPRRGGSVPPGRC